MARVAVSDDMIDWLRPRLVDARARGIDAYRDTRFEPELVRVWLTELRRVSNTVSSEAREAVAGQHGPRQARDRVVAARMLDEAAERVLARDPRWKTLQDAVALLELAHESATCVDVRGD